MLQNGLCRTPHALDVAEQQLAPDGSGYPREILLLLPGLVQRGDARLQRKGPNASDIEHCIWVTARCCLRRNKARRPWRLQKCRSHPLDSS